MKASGGCKRIIGIYSLIGTTWISKADRALAVFYMLSEAPKEAPEGVRAYVLEYLDIAERAPYSALKKRDKIAFECLMSLYSSVRTVLEAGTAGKLMISLADYVRTGRLKMGKNRYNRSYYSVYRTAVLDFDESMRHAGEISKKRKAARAKRGHFARAYGRLAQDQRIIDFEAAPDDSEYLSSASANFKRFWSLYSVSGKRTRKYSCKRLFIADTAINEHIDEFLFGLSKEVEYYKRDPMYAPDAFDYLLDIKKCHKWISGRVTNADKSTLDMLAKPWVPCN